MGNYWWERGLWWWEQLGLVETHLCLVSLLVTQTTLLVRHTFFAQIAPTSARRWKDNCKLTQNNKVKSEKLSTYFYIKYFYFWCFSKMSIWVMWEYEIQTIFGHRPSYLTSNIRQISISNIHWHLSSVGCIKYCSSMFPPKPCFIAHETKDVCLTNYKSTPQGEKLMSSDY